MAFDIRGEVEGAEWFTTKGENDLDILLLESDIYESKYVNPVELEELLKNCKEVMTAYELLHRAKFSRSKEYMISSANETVILGLSNFYEISKGVTMHLGARFGNFKYTDYGLTASERGHTQKFMKQLLNDPEVRDVIFLVPPRMYQTESDTGNATRSEFRFLLKNPELSKKVRLVFGAYQVIDRDKFNEDTWAVNGVVDRTMPTKMERNAGYVLADDFRKFVESVGK